MPGDAIDAIMFKIENVTIKNKMQGTMTGLNLFNYTIRHAFANANYILIKNKIQIIYVIPIIKFYVDA